MFHHEVNALICITQVICVASIGTWQIGLNWALLVHEAKNELAAVYCYRVG